MGWLAYGALAVSVSYLCYHHAPFLWDFGPWRCSHKAGDARPSPEPSPPQDESVDTGRRDDGSPQTTPKATPAPDPPRLSVPVLNLEEPPMVTATDTSIRPPAILKSLPPPSGPISNPTIKPASMMLPPPRPSSRAPLRPPPSAASSLRAPPPPRAPTASRLTSSTLSPMSLAGKPQTSSRQVVLEPGHSPLDWAVLTSDPRNNLRGKDVPPGLVRVTPSMLKLQNGRKGRDAWTSYQGKVYNITPYLPFHPGGKGELLRGAGKDSAKLFLEVHPWVNWDGMLAECMVGILVSENEVEQQTGKWDEMD